MPYEYQRVPWERVNEMAGQGWRLVPIPPVGELRNVLGQMQMGEPLYAMERETSGHASPSAPPVSALLIRDGQGPTSSGGLP